MGTSQLFIFLIGVKNGIEPIPKGGRVGTDNLCLPITDVIKRK